MSLKLRYDLFGAEVLGEARFTGKYEFPVIPGIKLDAVPGRFVPFDRAGTDLREGDWLHGYVHDKRFHRFLADADRQFKRIEKAAGYIGADNSVYRDLPLAEQIHSCYLNRAIDYFIWSKGKKVVQNVSWGDWRSYEFCFDGIPAEDMVQALDEQGICVSGGANKTLLAIGRTEEEAKTALRISVNEDNTEEEVRYLCEQVSACAARLRRP